MSQAILISDNEVVSSLYELNLLAYVAVDVTTKKDLAAASQLLEHAPNIDMVIIFKDKTSEGETEKFKSFLSEKSLEIPILFLGDQEVEFPNKIVIKNKYDIKSLLMAVAKILEVTPMQMASREVANYFPIPIRLLKNMKSIHCELFKKEKVEDFDFSYSLIAKKETEIGNVIQKVIKEAGTYLYIDAKERLRFINKTSGLIVNELSDPDISSSEKIEITSQGHNMVAEELFEDQSISKAVAKVSKVCVSAIKEIVQTVPNLKKLLGMLVENKANYVFKHGVLATYISSEIIKNISWGSQEQIDKVAFSLYFHDLFLVPLFNKYENVMGEEELLLIEGLSQAERDLILNHAQMAGEVVKKFPRAPMGADMIITQHHGKTSGQGFADTYKDDISPLSKIIVISEDIASGIFKDIQAGNKDKALDVMRISERLNSRYSYSSYKKIIKAFETIKL
jgi:HD-GYP domain-containing protein (c-di-GMP phosphodiesterase class II)